MSSRRNRSKAGSLTVFGLDDLIATELDPVGELFNLGLIKGRQGRLRLGQQGQYGDTRVATDDWNLEVGRGRGLL